MPMDKSRNRRNKRLTYYKEHKNDDDRKKASITQYSPPKALFVTFLFVVVCNGPTPTTFENRCTRWKHNAKSTTPAGRLIIISALGSILLLYVTYMSNQGSYKIFKLWKKKASNNSHEVMTETKGKKHYK
jgi:hypothetical protein